MTELWPFLAGVGVGVVLTIAAIGAIGLVASSRNKSKKENIL